MALLKSSAASSQKLHAAIPTAKIFITSPPAGRLSLVGRRLHLTTGRSACRVLSTSTSREVRTTANAGCINRARYHRGLARRYGGRAFFNCDNLARWRRCFYARRARTARLDSRQVRFGHSCGGGSAVIDPHGDLATDILDAIPRQRINDVCYLDAGETEYPVGFNPATGIAPRTPGAGCLRNRRGIQAPVV